jgi:hypothetical protein
MAYHWNNIDSFKVHSGVDNQFIFGHADSRHPLTRTFIILVVLSCHEMHICLLDTELDANQVRVESMKMHHHPCHTNKQIHAHPRAHTPQEATPQPASVPFVAQSAHRSTPTPASAFLFPALHRPLWVRSNHGFWGRGKKKAKTSDTCKVHDNRPEPVFRNPKRNPAKEGLSKTPTDRCTRTLVHACPPP